MTTRSKKSRNAVSLPDHLDAIVEMVTRSWAEPRRGIRINLFPLRFEVVLKGTNSKTRKVPQATLGWLDDIERNAEEAGQLPKRQRGDRSKRMGGQFLERLAVMKMREVKQQLISEGHAAGRATELAIRRVAGMVGVSPETFQSWVKRKAIRERAAPKEVRTYRRRKRKNVAKSRID